MDQQPFFNPDGVVGSAVALGSLAAAIHVETTKTRATKTKV
jgi:hypothetical protein